MEHIVNKAHEFLLKTAQTISVAESCTAGLLAKLLTDLAGSSVFFMLGIIAYNNKAKENILKIPAKIIQEKGAVSKEVADKMAQSVRKLGHSDIGISITGIAGPHGGSINKPVGTVFIAINTRQKTLCRKFNFKGTRLQVRQQAALAAIKLILKEG